MRCLNCDLCDLCDLYDYYDLEVAKISQSKRIYDKYKIIPNIRIKVQTRVLQITLSVHIHPTGLRKLSGFIAKPRLGGGRGNEKVVVIESEYEI